MKPLYKIIAVIVLIVIAGLGIYLGWRKIVSAPENTNNSQSVQNQPSAAVTSTAVKIELKKISDQPVFDFVISSSTREIIYFTPEGRIFQAENGTDNKISDQAIAAINLIKLSPANQKILAAFGDPHRPQWLIFDLIDRVWRPLPIEIINASWGADDNELFVLTNQNNAVNLSRFRPSQTPINYEVIMKDFGFSDINLDFKPPQFLLITERPSFFYAGRSWQFDLKKSELTHLAGPENGLTIIWSVDKSTLFKFSTNGWLIITAPNFSLPFNTLSQKCGADNSVIYCFEPKNWPDNIKLPDDYLQRKFYTNDNLYRYDSENGLQILEIPTNQFLDALKPTPFSDALYFLNRKDDGLYGLAPLSKISAEPISF